MPYADFYRQKSGIRYTKNDENFCLPRALVLARAWAEGRPAFRAMADNTIGQNEVVAELLKRSGTVVPREGCDIQELWQFQQDLREQYNIGVYEYKSEYGYYLKVYSDLQSRR